MFKSYLNEIRRILIKIDKNRKRYTIVDNFHYFLSFLYIYYNGTSVIFPLDYIK